MFLPWAISITLSLMKSHALNLQSRAKLNIVNSRKLFAKSSLVLIDQTSSSFRGSFLTYQFSFIPARFFGGWSHVIHNSAPMV